MPTIQLAPQAALLPTSGFPLLKRHASSGSGLPEMWILEYANAADNTAFWTFVIPADFSAMTNIRIFWMADTATANECRWATSITCASDDADDLDTVADDTDVTSDDTTGSVAGEFSIATHDHSSAADSMAANDVCVVRVMRDGDHANDDLADVAQLIMVCFDYTAT